MICEMAEERLSAYLDDMLDPQARAQIQVHLDDCVHCRETMADYRRYDEALAHLPQVTPPDSLRARIFESPEFLALVAEQARDEQRHDHERQRAAAARVTKGKSPSWPRVALQLAAVFALILGSALLVKQGLFPSGNQQTSTSTRTIGDPGSGVPLAAGSRLVYARDGALWSAPENGPGLAQRLTPAGVSVGVWSVSPNGRHVAYADAHGALHTIRSDGLSDTTIVSASSAISMLAWSPTGDQLAYVRSGAAGDALHLVNATGANDRALPTGVGVTVATAIWSPDGLRLAYVESLGTGQTLWAYDLVSHQTAQLAAQADAAAPAAHFTQLAWLPDTLRPAVTWAARNDTSSTITGVFTRFVLSGELHRLTPASSTYTAADFTAASGDGMWLLARSGDSPTLTRLAAGSGAASGAPALVSAPVRDIVWSPRGDAAAFVTTDGELGMWSPGAIHAGILRGVGDDPPAWSPGGSRLAVQTQQGVIAVGTSGDQTGVTVNLLSAGGPVGIRWAPDGQRLALVSASGVTIVGADGTGAKLADTHAAQGSFAWSVAG
jgi:Tol biopolymer transport system component